MGDRREGQDIPGRVELVRICCWGDASGSTESVWNRVRRACNHGAVVQHMHKIARVQQRGGVMRYDMYCRRGYEQRFMEYFRRHQRRWGWYVRLHKEGRNRVRAVRGIVEAAENRIQYNPNGGDSLLSVGTYNVNGIKKKKRDVEYMLRREKLDVLAMQETLQRDTDWELRIPGYHCFEVAGSRQASQRGLCILIRDGYNGYEVGENSPWCVLVRVSGGGLTSPAIVGSVYIPHTATRAVMERVQQQVMRAVAECPTDPVLLLGDWNMMGNVLDNYLWEWPVHFQRVRMGENQRTRRGIHGRQIDGLVCKSMAGAPGMSAGKVQRKWDMSDHYLVKWQMRKHRADVEGENGNGIALGGVERPAAVNVVSKVDLQKLCGQQNVEVRARFVHSNRFNALIEEEGRHLGTEALAQAWVETVHAVVADEECYVRKGVKPKKWAPNRAVCKMIEKRCQAYVAVNEVGLEPLVLAQRWEVYEELKRQCKTKVKAAKNKEWHQTIQTASINMAANPAKFWRWASNLARWNRKMAIAGAQPVCDPVTRQLLTDSRLIQEAWRTHYGGLAADVTGHSRDAGYWRDKFQQIPMVIRNADRDLNGPISDTELCQALQHMKNNKAAGTDAIPAEILKLLIPENGLLGVMEWELNGNQPPMWLALKRLVNLQWETAIIPSMWRSSVVVSIPKKGDLSIMDNYRGISLMGTSLKLLLTIVTQRLGKVCEEQLLFTKAQAGFRKLEECVIQSATLLEICKRRSIREMQTVVVFVDIKKAYDTVPHEALMRKLHAYGIRGRMLQYIRALYAESTIQVRSGDPPVYQLSDPVPLLRGLRQGCPLSPILFNVFINDILDGMDQLGLGVSIPGVEERIQGLLFADDLAVTAHDGPEVERMLECLSQWLRDNEMAVGIGKCGIMVAGGVEDNAMLEATPERWCINGARIPIVQEYRYLGIMFNMRLEVADMMVERLESARKLVAQLNPFLRSTSIPLHMRAAVVKAVILPRLLFGAEVYGMNKAITAKMQKFLNLALRAMAGVSKKAPVSMVALWREFGIAPICAYAAARRGRAWQKCSSSRTWMRQLVHGRFTSRCWTWLTGTQRWLTRYLRRYVQQMRHQVEGAEMVENWPAMHGKMLARIIQGAVWEREERCKRCNAADIYIDGRYEQQQVYRIGGKHHPALNNGLNTIIRCRIGGFWTAQRMAIARLVARRYLRWCPCCRQPVPEDLYHILWVCARWEMIRVQWLQPLRGDPSIVRVQNDDRGDVNGNANGVVALLLGGEHHGERIHDWMPPKHTADVLQDEFVEAEPGGEADTEQGSDTDSSSEGQEDFQPVFDDPERDICACHRVARFLTEMVRARAPIIRAIRRANGMR